MNKEKVIFRKGKNEYIGDYYMAIFPNDEANYGNVCYVDLWKNGNEWDNDCYSEISKLILWKSATRIVHKNDPIVSDLVSVLQDLYGGEYQVVEKIVKGMKTY